MHQNPTPNQFPPVWTNSARSHRRPISNGGLIGIVVGLVFLLCLGFSIIGAIAPKAEPTPISTTRTTMAPTTPTARRTPSQAPVTTPPARPTTVPAKPVGGEGAVDQTIVVFKAGQRFQVGGFRVTLNGRKCGLTRVGSTYLNTKAKGSFCRFDLTALNTTKRAHSYNTSTSILAYDSQGRQFQPDGEAGIYGNEDGAGWFEEINPGTATRAFVFFDLPKGAKLDRLEFDPGLFSMADTVTVKF